MGEQSTIDCPFYECACIKKEQENNRLSKGIQTLIKLTKFERNILYLKEKIREVYILVSFTH